MSSCYSQDLDRYSPSPNPSSSGATIASMGLSQRSPGGDFVIEVIEDYATAGAEDIPKSPRKVSEASTLVGPDDDQYPLRKPSATFSAGTSSAASTSSNNFSRRTPCPPYWHPNPSTSSSVRFANVDYNTPRSPPRQPPQWPLYTPRRSRPTPIYGEKQYYLNLGDDEKPQRPMIKAKSTGDLITPELAAKGRNDRPPRTFKSVIVKSGGSDTEALYSPIVEFIAVFIASLVGLSGQIFVALSLPVPGHYDGGSFLLQTLCNGFGTMIGTYIAGGISSAHMNPVVTFVYKYCKNQRKNFTLWRCTVYMLAQLIATFLAAIVAVGIHYDALELARRTGGLTGTGASISTTPGTSNQESNGTIPFNLGAALYFVPPTTLRWWQFLLSDMFSAFCLVFFLLGLRDENNYAPQAHMGGLIAGLAVSGLGMAFGCNTGGMSNPARDMGSRLGTIVWGFGEHALTGGYPVTDLRAWWPLWGAWGIPFVGGALGAVGYEFMVGPVGERKVNRLAELKLSDRVER